MIPLDDPMWEDYQGNHTSGSTVAGYLLEAKRGASIDRWYDPIFQELLHQYSLSQVAYAAVPHLVEIAESRADTRLHLIVLVGACYAHSADPGTPPLPPLLEDEWRDARRRVLPLALDLLKDPDLGEGDVRYLLSSLAAFKGQNELSQAIEALDSVFECPVCGGLIEIAGMETSSNQAT